MVNVEDSKPLILTLLRHAEKPVGGETLAQAAGISRVAVWKQIQSLRDLGYGIESARLGYLLSRDADTPASWEIRPQGNWNIFFAPTADSTMERCRRLKAEDLPAVMIAGAQSEARSRDGRRWKSPAGGLYATLRLIPEGCLLDTPILCACASLAAARTLKEVLHRDATVRWPNEILIDEKKAGGVLVEASGALGHVEYLAVGIGLWPGDFHRAQLAQNLLDNFDDLWRQKHEAFMNWKLQCAQTALRQKNIASIRINGETCRYENAVIDGTGCLVLKDKARTSVCGFSDKIEYRDPSEKVAG